MFLNPDQAIPADETELGAESALCY
jgi:hypothetical protein